MRKRLHEIIFEADTPLGKAFDVVLLILITLSVLVVMLESVDIFEERYGRFFYITEWVLTGLFTLEYILRLLAVKRPIGYARSFFGIVDVLAILPTYLSLFFPGAATLMTIRTLRLLRLFRIFKLVRYVQAYQTLIQAMRQARPKIIVFMVTVLTVVVFVGSLMYLVEGGANSGFTSIPRSIYWAIVTVTTVGFGDITPVTELGQFLAAILMIIGYGIIAVPTGIVSVEIARAEAVDGVSNNACEHCAAEGHRTNANYCHRCGEPMESSEA